MKTLKAAQVAETRTQKEPSEATVAPIAPIPFCDATADRQPAADEGDEEYDVEHKDVHLPALVISI